MTTFNPPRFVVPRFAPSDRLKAILNQPGRVVRILGERTVEVTTQDEAADLEFHRHLPHAAAICGRYIAVDGAVGACYYILTLRD